MAWNDHVQSSHESQATYPVPPLPSDFNLVPFKEKQGTPIPGIYSLNIRYLNSIAVFATGFASPIRWSWRTNHLRAMWSRWSGELHRCLTMLRMSTRWGFAVGFQPGGERVGKTPISNKYILYIVCSYTNTWLSYKHNHIAHNIRLYNRPCFLRCFAFLP